MLINYLKKNYSEGVAVHHDQLHVEETLMNTSFIKPEIFP